MVLEATMICVDDSEWMRNGDYRPSRFEAQSDAVAIICGTKMQANPENTVGVLAMAGKGVRVLVTPTDDLGKVLASMHGLEISGEANLAAAIQVAQLALKHRQNKMQQQRIIVFVGSPVEDEKNVLEEIGKKLKKNNISLDVVDLGESDNEKPEKLEALVAAVNNGGNSHIIHVPPGEDFLSEVLLSSPILAEDIEGSGFTAAANGESSFEFGVDPNVDPELALALRISMEEERVRQEAAAKKATEESSKAESKGQSSTLNGDTVMADKEPAPNPCTGDNRNQMKDDEDQLLHQVHAMLIKDSDSGTVPVADAEMLDSATNDPGLAALQMSLQDGKTDTQFDMSEVFGDQPSAQSVTYAHSGLDPNDPSHKDLLEWIAQLNGPREPKKERKKQHKKQKKKHRKKEDKPESDKNQ